MCTVSRANVVAQVIYIQTHLPWQPHLPQINTCMHATPSLLLASVWPDVDLCKHRESLVEDQKNHNHSH